MKIKNLTEADAEELIEQHEKELAQAYIAGWCAHNKRGRPTAVLTATEISKNTARDSFRKWNQN